MFLQKESLQGFIKNIKYLQTKQNNKNGQTYNCYVFVFLFKTCFLWTKENIVCVIVVVSQKVKQL